jgi:hypothetical protein
MRRIRRHLGYQWHIGSKYEDDCLQAAENPVTGHYRYIQEDGSFLSQYPQEVIEDDYYLALLRAGRPVVGIAYPNAKQSHYPAQRVALVRETGFAYACSNVPGVVTRSTDRFQLPRIHAHDWDGETFCEHLLEWFDG